MNVIECIKKRRSIRKYKQYKVEHEVIEQLIDCRYPAEEPKEPRRKEVSEMLRYR